MVIVTLLACAADRMPSREIVISDSSGVRIISFATEAPAVSWQLPPEPEVTIGVTEGNPAYELNGVRAAILLPDQAVVLANSGSNDIRVYDAAGRHVRTFGRTGEGPGEYRGLSLIARAGGDTLYAFDRWLQRLTYFTPDGKLVRTVSVEAGSAAAVRLLTDGRIVPTAFLSGMPTRPRGVHADTAVLAAYAPDGLSSDTIGRFVVLEWFSHSDGRPPTPLPWGQTHFVAVARDRVHVAPSDEFEVRTYDPSGALVQIVRGDGPRPAVDERALEFVRDAWLSRVARNVEARQRRMQEWEALPRPAALPVLSALVAADDGTLWTRTFHADTSAPAIWWVFGIDGRPIARIPSPSGMTILDATRDFIVGRRSNELGVESVQVYRIRRE